MSEVEYDNKNKNSVAEIFFRASDGLTYQCAGVLLHVTDKKIRVAFNAIDNIARDYIDIAKKDVIRMRELAEQEILHVGALSQ